MNRRDFPRFTGIAAVAAWCKSCISFEDSSTQPGDTDMADSEPQQSKPMIAPCGLNCDECSIRKAANDRGYAEKLAAKWRKSGRTKAAADWFKCQGCHGPEELVWSAPCDIRTCCTKTKALANCSYCSEFPCSLIEKFATDGYAHHAKAVQHLKELRRLQQSRP